MHLMAAGALSLLALVVLAPLLWPGMAPYSPYSDVLAEHLATKRVAYQALREGHALPFWRDDQLGGTVALTNPQALYLHPLHVLFWLMPPEAAVGPSFALALWVAALGSYAFACSLGARIRGAVFAGVCTLVSAKLLLAVYAGWLAPLATIALLPWVLFGCTRLCETPTRARASLLGAICAVAFSGGTPQTVYYALLLAVPYAVFAARDARHALVALAWIAAAVGLGLLCNAYLWAAVLGDLSLITRGASQADPAFFTSGHALGLRALWTLFVPPFMRLPENEPWEEVAYFGGASLALAFMGIQSRRTRYFALALLASLLLSLDTPLTSVLRDHLPGYAQFRLPARMLFVTTFIGVALGGVGLDRLLRRLATRTASWLLAVLVLAVVAEGGLHARAFLGTAPQTELLPDADHPARALGAQLQPGARVALLGDALSYGWTADLGLRAINGYDPYHYTHQAVLVGLLESGRLEPTVSNWVRLRGVARPDLLDELGVELVLGNTRLTAPNLRLLAEHPRVRDFSFYQGMRRAPLLAYRNTSARAYARFAGEVHTLPSQSAIAARIASERLTGQAYVLGDGTRPDVRADGSAVQVESYRAGAVRLVARARSRQLLVVCETFHPGWQARVDGRAQPLMAANLSLLGLWVAPGEHRIELEFRPPELGYHAALGVLALLAILVLGGAGTAGKSAARRSSRQERGALSPW